jgi:DnaD/phage-associated family protein
MLGELLERVDSLDELKAILHTWRRIQEHRGTPKFVLASDLGGDRSLARSLDDAYSTPLQSAVDRGVFLRVELETGDACILLNTPANRRWADELRGGLRTVGDLHARAWPAEPAVVPERPSIYELYEQNVGLLTPLVAEQLQEIEAAYPSEWVVAAFREAATNNRRSLGYIRRILEAWARDGRGSSGTTRKRPAQPQAARDYRSTRYGRIG